MSKVPRNRAFRSCIHIAAVVLDSNSRDGRKFWRKGRLRPHKKALSTRADPDPMASQHSASPWKLAAIVLAILLTVVLIAAGLVVAGIMDLGFSLF
jgi:hypothetical protein